MNRHFAEAVDDRRVDAREVVGVAVERETVETGQDRLEHDLRLEPGEARAEAEVRAAGAERDVVVRLAGDVERVRAAANTRSSRLADEYTITTRSPSAIALAADLGVVDGRAGELDHRCHVAQQLLDRGREQRQVAAQRSNCSGCCEQHERCRS